MRPLYGRVRADGPTPSGRKSPLEARANGRSTRPLPAEQEELNRAGYKVDAAALRSQSKNSSVFELLASTSTTRNK